MIELIVIGAAALLGAVAVALWPALLGWVRENLEPWIEAYEPSLLPIFRQALSHLDEVAVGLRRGVKAAWAKLRRRVVRQTAAFEQRGGADWLLRITSWIAESLGPAQDGTVSRVVTEQQLHYDELPLEVRRAVLVSGGSRHEIDITATRDRELDLAVSG